MKVWCAKFRDWLLLKNHNHPKFYSFIPLLTEKLIEKNPKKILEWGCGQSTMLMQLLCPNAEIHSIEHDWRWFVRQKMSLHGVNIHFIPSGNNYATPDFPEKYFDLIFIDNDLYAHDCILSAKRFIKDDGVIIAHGVGIHKVPEGCKTTNIKYITGVIE